MSCEHVATAKSFQGQRSKVKLIASDQMHFCEGGRHFDGAASRLSCRVCNRTVSCPRKTQPLANSTQLHLTITLSS